MKYDLKSYIVLFEYLDTRKQIEVKIGALSIAELRAQLRKETRGGLFAGTRVLGIQRAR